jgi:hypothetical protein
MPDGNEPQPPAACDRGYWETYGVTQSVSSDRIDSQKTSA